MVALLREEMEHAHKMTVITFDEYMRAADEKLADTANTTVILDSLVRISEMSTRLLLILF